MKSLPTAYRERMQALLGNEFTEYEHALCEPPVRAFRVNTDKISAADFSKLDTFSDGRIPYVENGFYLSAEKIGAHPYHHAGMLYVQEPAAMAPASCIDIQPDWHVLDMCAAPGGKSSQLKNKLGPAGLLVANEVIPARCRILMGNVERLGLRNVVTTCMDTGRLAQCFAHRFDLVMVDAPCSGEGMFRKDDVAIDEWSEENVRLCAQRQAEILENAARAVRDGGYILYATCTFSLEENERTVDRFLRTHPEFALVPVRPEVEAATVPGICFDGCRCAHIEYTRRFYPHRGRGEGQFMAVLHHMGEAKRPLVASARHALLPDRAVLDFLDDVLLSYERDHVTMYNGNPVYMAPMLQVERGTAFSFGVTIGEIRKNYIQPHHQFFGAMGNLFRRKIDLTLDSPRLYAYLRGEEIEADCPSGWAVVRVDGCTIGGAKVSGGRAKNHYPKGLRLL